MSFPLKMEIIQPHRVFVILALVFGTSLVFVTAPFQVPDETDHFWRAYQVSEAEFIPQQRDGWPMGELPASVADLHVGFDAIPFHPEAKTSAAQIKGTLHIPLNPGTRILERVRFGVYSPTAYFPQALGILIGRWFHAPPLALMYLGRLFNLLAWTALGYASLRIMPVGRWAIMLLLLMPMSLFEAASLSADAMTNGLAIFVTAMVWRYAVAKDSPRIEIWPLIVLAMASIALTMGKIAYIPLAGLIFLIPSDRLGGKRRYAIITSAFCLANIAALAWWASRTPGLDLRQLPGTEPRAQLALLLHHPMELAVMPLDTWMHRFFGCVMSFVGVLGWLDTWLPTPLIGIYLLALLVAALPSADESPLPNLRRLIAITIPAILGSIYLITILDYLFWTPVGANLAEGLQGRYFIPLAPAGLLLFRGLAARWLPARWTKSVSDNRWNIAVAAFSLFFCVVTVVVVYRRYYVA